MKYFYFLMKPIGLLTGALGLVLAYNVWTYQWPRLFYSILWGMPAYDLLVIAVGILFGLFALVYATAEGRTWKNVLCALPLALANVLMIGFWLYIERQSDGFIVGQVMLTGVMLVNALSAVVYLFRRIELPAIIV